jgi:hypothetical protein
LKPLKSFSDKLGNGDGLNIGNPMLTLRNKLIENKCSEKKLNSIHIIYLIIRAWNAYISGKELRILRVNTNEKVEQINEQIKSSQREARHRATQEST